MTLKELYEQAKYLIEEGTDPETPVLCDGCDCIENADELVYTNRKGNDYVILVREESHSGFYDSGIFLSRD